MKKITIMMVLAMATTGIGFAAVSGTDHDLSAADSNTETCIFCHTPHNATPDVPLWNHTLSGNTFTAYDSPTMQATDNNNWAGNNGSISALCMSCHDGSVGLGSVINDHGGTITDPGPMGAVTANLGTDLTNDHPVVFTYDSNLVTADGELVDPATLTGDVRLFGPGADQMECASCHDPHNSTATEQPFLVTSNAASALCRTCHQK